MKERLLKLSDGTENLLVLVIAFGLFVPGNLAALFSPDTLARPDTPPITNGHLQGLVLYELVILGVLTAFLRARGWTLERLGARPSIRDSLYGAGLCVGYYAFYWLLVILLASVWPTFGQLLTSTHLVGADLRWPTVTLVSAINPMFEEVFVCGYVITALKDRMGVTTAINMSAGLRVFCHFYQGAGGSSASRPSHCCSHTCLHGPVGCGR